MVSRSGFRPRSARLRAALAATVLAVALPANALSVTGYNTPSLPYVMPSGLVADVEFKALINSGEGMAQFGTIFQGIPDGIGVFPGDGDQGNGMHDDGQGGGDGDDEGQHDWVDLYVAHEESSVPFGTLPTNHFADFQDSSVTRVRVDIETMSVIDMEVALPASAGFIRFCSAFMAGPQHGFPRYTFLVNEESNDQLPVRPGAVYGPDPYFGGAALRQAGYAVYLDTVTGTYDALPGQGRHNHENNVIVPGGWRNQIVSLSGDDTFTTTSTLARPNLSQLYMHSTRNAATFRNNEGTLWAFRVTGTGGAPIDPTAFDNNANDFFEIGLGDTWTGEFIPVREDVANGMTDKLPQDALEDWSNENNVFQFIRVEDIAYDPDDPRTIYFTDTGNTRLFEEESIGRLVRLSSSDPRSGSPTVPPTASNANGRIFKMVLNASDPTKVDAFSVVADAGSGPPPFSNVPTPTPAGQPAMRAPDNLDVGHNSIMVQEDTSNAKIWMNALGTPTWIHVATATQPSAETSGIIDVSEWFGDGWWALDVQSHVNLVATDPNAKFTWTGPPGPAVGTQYQKRLEDGQLLLMRVPGS